NSGQGYKSAADQFIAGRLFGKDEVSQRDSKDQLGGQNEGAGVDVKVAKAVQQQVAQAHQEDAEDNRCDNGVWPHGFDGYARGQEGNEYRQSRRKSVLVEQDEISVEGTETFAKRVGDAVKNA